MNSTPLMAATALTPIQAGMIYETLAQADASVNLEQVVLHLDDEPMDLDRMAQAWGAAIARHAALRLVVQPDGVGALRQFVAPAFAAPLTVEDWTNVLDVPESLAAFLAQDRARGVDLSQAGGWRLQWLQLGARQSVLVWTFSHVILDGRSFRQVLDEVFDAYDGVPQVLTDMPSFMVHCATLAQGDMAAARAHFRGYLAGFDLPTAVGFAAGQGVSGPDAGQPLQARLTVAQSDALRRRAAVAGVSFATLVQAAWGIVLARVSGQGEAVFGVTRSGRYLTPDARGMVGCLITTQPLRMSVGGAVTLDALLAAIRRDLVAQRPHEALGLSEIAAGTDLPHGAPLFQSLVMVERESLQAAMVAKGGMWANRRVELFEHGAEPLTLAVYGDSEMLLQVDHDAGRIGAQDAARYLAYVTTLLIAMAEAGPETLLCDLDMLSTAETAALRRCALPMLPLPAARPACIATAFEATAAQSPMALAVAQVGHADALDYASLERRANQWAHRLRQWGVGQGAILGLCLPRGPDFTVLVLACAKAGAAFLPMDPSYPAEALLHMAEDSAVPLIFAEAVAPWMVNFTVVLTADGPPQDAPETPPNRAGLTEDRAAYVIYTSGTTGKPKGVAVSQRSFVAHALAAIAAYGLGPSDRVLQFAALSFDVALEEITPTLLAGATLILRDAPMLASPQAFCEAVAAQGITVLNLPTGFWQVLLAALEAGTAALPATLRLMIVGGERMPPDALARWQAVPGVPRLINAYGPTEAVITCAAYEPLAAVTGPEVPVGRSFGHALTYLRAADGSLAPMGARAELWIGGDAVALGYLNHPTLTAQRFVPDPFAGHGRLYRSGDMAHWDAQGQLIIAGRSDRQIKLRGFRIEPAEVEATLEAIPGIAQAYVGVRAGRLIGWLRASNPDAPPELAAISAYIATQLPPAKCPELIVVQHWPQTPGGKIDVAGLPDPTIAAPPDAAAEVYSLLAAKIAEVFASVLGGPVPPPAASFFDLGGHSLQLLTLIGHIEAMFGTRLTVAQLHAHPTPQGLAALLSGPAQVVPNLDLCDCLMPIQPLGAGVPIYGVHVLGVNGSYFRPLAKVMGLNQPIFGLTVGLLSENTPDSVADTAALYFDAIQAHRPTGPVGLVAVSLGSYMALELAQRLDAAGREVRLLAMMDAEGPGGRDKIRGRAWGVAHLGLLRAGGIGYARSVIGGKLETLRHKLEQVRLSVGRRVRTKSLAPKSMDAFVAANAVSIQRYNPRPYAGRMMIIRADANVFDSPRAVETGLGWHEVAQAGFDVVNVPGDHLSIMEEPGIQEVAAAFAKALGPDG